MCIKELYYCVTPFITQLVRSYYNDWVGGIKVFIMERQCNGGQIQTDVSNDASKTSTISFFLLSPCARVQSRRFGSLPKLLNDIRRLASRLRSTSPLRERASDQSEETPSAVLQPRPRRDHGVIDPATARQPSQSDSVAVLHLVTDPNRLSALVPYPEKSPHHSRT